ncbi:fungal mating-type pheromone [Coprinopsis cinerea okayama7|uniref:Fungal mating-type pheromone n=1 Tax=Coprinopsis cinerea (strain Okayama-7 / 130 / ATCC MYA-4618 / FGSC 9003) TaxID=240176 RepID=A8NHV7_COPC7|nr:fungal mating-type pheromone [Coprinopsis cinerea okayama7\|eukprot:XP_001833838.2 fungal mating-type pheromone [Coprinopsis cinerea okayama7\
MDSFQTICFSSEIAAAPNASANVDSSTTGAGVPVVAAAAPVIEIPVDEERNPWAGIWGGKMMCTIA